MRTLLIVHEVDDVGRWLTSATRQEVFGPLGITARPFVDAGQPNRVGLIIEAPSMELFAEAMGSLSATAVMEHDGVRAGTVHVLTET